MSHGDLKPSNIILSKNGPVLLDLDSLRIHRLGIFYRRCREKDRKKFRHL